MKIVHHILTGMNTVKVLMIIIIMTMIMIIIIKYRSKNKITYITYKITYIHTDIY